MSILKYTFFVVVLLSILKIQAQKKEFKLLEDNHIELIDSSYLKQKSTVDANCKDCGSVIGSILKVNEELSRLVHWKQNGEYMEGEVLIQKSTIGRTSFFFTKNNLPLGTIIIAKEKNKGNSKHIKSTIKNKNKDFALGHLFDEKFTINIYIPKKYFSEFKSMFMGVAYYNEKRIQEYDSSMDCHPNAFCENNINNTPWCNEIRSTVALEFPYFDEIEDTPRIGLCTGVLINSEGNATATSNFTPYIASAAHCINEPNRIYNLQQAIVRFNWQSSTCTPDNIVPIQYTRAGLNLIFLADGNFLYNCTDFAFFEMENPPQFQANVYYSGWTADWTENGNEVTAIHHPRGDIKKIAQGNRVASPFYPYCIRVDWRVGATERGSSGGPLWNASKLLVGNLVGSAGASNQTGCGDDADQDLYSPFAEIYPYIDDLLMPNGTGTDEDFLIGADPLGNTNGCSLDDITIDDDFYPASWWQPQNKITIQARNKITVDNQLNILTSIRQRARNGSNYVLRSGGGIIIKPGFMTNFSSLNQSGFVATIGTCESFSGCGFNFATKIANPSGGVTDIENKTEDKFNPSVFETVSLGNGLPVYPTEPMVYPNPFFDALQVVFEVGTEQNIHISLMDVYSKSLYEKVYQNYSGNLKEQIPTAHLSKGCYLLRISYGDKQTVKKVIKE